MQSPDGKSERGDDGGKALEVVAMMRRRKMEVLCVQETKWKGDMAGRWRRGTICFTQEETEGVMVLVSS